jgi:hypothetical protein
MANFKKISEKQKELIWETNALTEYQHQSIVYGLDPDYEEVIAIKLSKIKLIESEIKSLESEPEDNTELEDKLIDFANWYLRLIKVTTDKNERFDIENREIDRKSVV